MSNCHLLILEEPLCVLPSLVHLFGSVEDALVLQQIHYWLTRPTVGKRDENGKKWMFNTLESWRTENFTWMSVKTISRILGRLEKLGVLETSTRFNSNPFDQKKWYSINYQILNDLCKNHTSSSEQNRGDNSLNSPSSQNWEIDLPELGDRSPRIGKSISKNWEMKITENTKQPEITKNQILPPIELDRSNRANEQVEGDEQEFLGSEKNIPLPEKQAPEQIEAEKKAQGLKNSYRALEVLLESSGNSLSVGDWVDCENPPEGFKARLPRRLEKLWRERLAGYVQEYGLSLAALEQRMKKLGEYLQARINHRFKTRNTTLEELCNPKSRLFFELVSESLSDWRSIPQANTGRPTPPKIITDPSWEEDNEMFKRKGMKELDLSATGGKYIKKPATWGSRRQACLTTK